jgi:sulfate permease, SulP family
MYKKIFYPKIFTILQGNYSFKNLTSDIIAGLTVAVVALPLSIALAVASGATPQQGIITAIVAGFTISLLSGSRVQVGGPTGAFVILVYNVIHQHGYDGLILATFLAGVILIIAALLRLGIIIQYISQSVIVGFTSGIAVIIFLGQLGDIFNLPSADIPHDIFSKVSYLFTHFAEHNHISLIIFFGLFATIIYLKKISTKIPIFLIIIFIAIAINEFFHLELETLGNRFSEISIDNFSFGIPSFTIHKLVAILPSAFTIALLAGIESLLSAVVADSMSGDRHHSNTELAAQGVANILSSTVGGLPATGAIARTATNIKSGAKSPLAGVFHALFILLMAWWFGVYLAYIPFIALASILVMVAWNMSEYKEFGYIIRRASDDRFVLLITFFLTIFVDLIMGISVGIILSSLIFVHKMSKDVSIHHKKGSTKKKDLKDNLPDNIFLITLEGSLFFGTVNRITAALDDISSIEKVLIIKLKDIHFLDISAAKKLKSFIDKTRKKTEIILCVPQKNVREKLHKFNVKQNLAKERIVDNIEDAINLGKSIIG